MKKSVISKIRTLFDHQRHGPKHFLIEGTNADHVVMCSITDGLEASMIVRVDDLERKCASISFGTLTGAPHSEVSLARISDEQSFVEDIVEIDDEALRSFCLATLEALNAKRSIHVNRGYE